MSFFFIIWRNLWCRRTRSLLTAAGVAVGVAAGVAMTGIARGFQRSFDQTHMVRGTDMIVARITTRNPMPALFDQKCALEIARLRGVQSVAVADWDYLTLDEGAATGVYGWEPGSYLWEHLAIKEGQFPNTANSSDCIYLGAICAEIHGKKLGDIVLIENRKLRVAGIFHSDSLFENGSAIVPLAVFQSILSREGKIKHLNIRFESGMPPECFDQLRNTIQGRFRGLKAFHCGELSNNSTIVQVSRAMSISTSCIALLIGTLGMMNTLLMSVFERTAEIGLLMAVGWCRCRVVAMILLESLTLGLAGGTVGLAAGILAVRIMQTMEFMNGKIAGEFSIGLIGVALAVSVGVGILGGLYPAVRAASMQPQAALRSE